jgi:glycosyltransferase involved in cell wall biosynthesis
VNPGHRTDQARPLVLDLFDLGANTKGVARVLTELAPRMFALAPERYRAVCSPLGLPILRRLGLEHVATVVRRVPNAVWEQALLPLACSRLGAAAVYSHRECGALWGPPQLLHVPEDPEIRWRREPTTAMREQLRRRYSRLLMDRSLIRAEVVVSTSATRDDLVHNHHLDPARAAVVPLGVDLDVFRPVSDGPTRPPFFFTLASEDERDRTDLILRAFAHYRRDLGGQDDLVIGGSLGGRADVLGRLTAELQVADSVELTGRLTDAELSGYNARAVATVHASPDEGFGLQPLEAMAGGSLLIATPSGAVREVAGDAVVLWVDPEVTPMADALRRADDDPALVEQARTRNRQVAESFSWDRTAVTLHARLVDLAGR